MLSEECGEVGSHGGGVFAGIRIPLGAEQNIERVVVDGLEVGGASLDDEINRGSREPLVGVEFGELAVVVGRVEGHELISAAALTLRAALRDRRCRSESSSIF